MSCSFHHISYFYFFLNFGMFMAPNFHKLIINATAIIAQMIPFFKLPLIMNDKIFTIKIEYINLNVTYPANLNAYSTAKHIP